MKVQRLNGRLLKLFGYNQETLYICIMTILSEIKKNLLCKLENVIKENVEYTALEI